VNKCRWCEEPVPEEKMFCDELCERLNGDYWAGQGSMMRMADRERAKREMKAKRNKVRSG
jgi:hypothetical protein